ncbi:MAG: peptidoglycan-binding protein [Clostridiales bacterium]|jgi:peptidoglycan hydrolase-like protein with peptidoglycan-binding domain|nr:peptidoglycan-binding protein [Clostridiales bacterium]
MVCARRILRIGNWGDDVAVLQNILASLDYYSFTIDGLFGPLTRQAVMNLQRDNGLVPDGIVGPLTYDVIDQLIP